jgi:hypothetical protein
MYSIHETLTRIIGIPKDNDCHVDNNDDSNGIEGGRKWPAQVHGSARMNRGRESAARSASATSMTTMMATAPKVDGYGNNSYA